MASKIYNVAKYQIAKQMLDWESYPVIKVMLVNDAYTVDPDHQFVSDIESYEVSGGAYARLLVTGREIALDTVNDKVILDCDDIDFSELDCGVVGGAILYAQTGSDDSTPEDDVLIGFVDTPNIITNGTDVSIQTQSLGLINF